MKRTLHISITEEKLQEIIVNAVNKAIGKEDIGLLTHEDIESIYGFTRVTVYLHIKNGIIPADACTYKNGRRYIMQSALDCIPKYLKRKRKA